ncbi:MAG: peptide chain release factor 2 [Acidimicrobiia bacterium]|nr:peptide chain release factor 2 [Acidimicrobiia bacterium]MYC57438.1 peptide chain release factor 2 [Acidimicrobiia bacterium]MYG93741.1 peptide chain release factor 2 [Acidimicrobiia bacterium]MYI30665.1 peptide chain release factor 2 [Acidimicrobiia bacterium]
MPDFSNDLTLLRAKLEEAHGYLRIGELNSLRVDLEKTAAAPDLWDDPDRARKVNRELAELTEDLELFTSLELALEDADTLQQLASEEGDESLVPEIADMVMSLTTKIDALELRSLLGGEHDSSDAVCELHSGAGGTDAQDWAEMLLAMYQGWAERRGFGFQVDSVSEGQGAGISSADFTIVGRNAYGLLQSERGVHRLVRISPFDSDARRHTAFAQFKVVPLFDAVSEEVDIQEKDLRVDTFRSSGAGGQHVNVTDSAVRITHLPTGVVVSCQNERSQHQNKDRAMQILAARLADLKRAEREAELAGLAGDHQKAEWGSQIRSYVLHPYQQVKDDRTGVTVGNVEAVLGGDLDELMEAYLRWRRCQHI